MAFIRRVRTASGATAVQVVHKLDGKIIRLEHIGSAHTEERLAVLLALAAQRKQGAQRSLFELLPTDSPIKLRQTVSTVLLTVLTKLYVQLGFDALKDTVFRNLCLARLVEPTSKLDSLRVLADLGVEGVSKDQVHRCLKRVIARDYRSQLAKFCFAHASQGGGITLVLYDVTTLYFETKETDEDTYRKPGMSKERRLDPQIVVGLLVDQTGFPLELHSFEGNKAETKTIIPVVEQFKRRHGLIDLTIVADAGMLSQNNLDELAKAGYAYIVGSRIYKVPYDIAVYQKTNELADESSGVSKEKELQDGQIFAGSTAVEGQRIIYQYRAKRAARDLKNIAKQVEKANKIIGGKAVAKKAKFMTVAVEGKQTKQLNQTLIDKAKALAGIKGYVTNLSPEAASDKQIIAYYHQLWHVEQSFRMSKNDLRARPIFHHTKDAIEAHLTIVMAALAVGKLVERKTGRSLKQVVKILRPVRSGIVVIGGKEYAADPVIPDDVVLLLTGV